MEIDDVGDGDKGGGGDDVGSQRTRDHVLRVIARHSAGAVTQAASQDPGLYLLAVACLQNLLVVAVPFKGEGSFFVEHDLDDRMGKTRVLCRPSAPGGRRLSASSNG